MPKKGSSIIIKKILGALLAIIGIAIFIELDILMEWEWWSVAVAAILLVSAYFLLIAGRQLK